MSNSYGNESSTGPPRRSSLGMPLSSAIFPRSQADRNESYKLTRAMEEQYGFHYITNTFCLNAMVERDYQEFFTETTLIPACLASLVMYLLWFLVSLYDAYSVVADDAIEQRVARLRLCLSLVVFVPVPILVVMCRTRRFQGYEQHLLCLVVHCFAFVILAGGALMTVKDYQSFLLKDYQDLVVDMLAVTGGADATDADTLGVNGLGSERIVIKNSNSTGGWRYRDMTGSPRSLLLQYMWNVMLPIAHLNVNLVRPLLVLVMAPLFKLDPYHYILTALTTNFSYCVLVSLLYPPTTSTFFILNKFYLVIVLVGASLVMALRVRQTDRFLRLNFLHARTVEERARASHLQKEIIVNENRSLKKMLEDRNKIAAGGSGLDFDAPMAKVILDLKYLQQTASLAPEMRQHLEGIVVMLSKKGQNLFAPDIHEQLRQKRETDLDGDTKSWASTVLVNKAYSRNRRGSGPFTKATGSHGDSTPGGGHHQSPVNPARTSKKATSATSSSPTSTSQSSSGSSGNAAPKEHYTEARLHPDVELPIENVLNDVFSLMERDGWSVDTFEVARLSNNKPLTYITYIVFEQHNLFDLLAVNTNVLSNFLHFLDLGYHRNPYHNNCHAADVVSSVYYLISVLDNGYIQELLNYQEIFAAIVAAAIHDFRHPGKTNNFMVKSGSEVAIEYSDSSVLERMHLAEAFFLARDPGFNIFGGMVPFQVSDVRKAIIEMVLSTDLSVHLQVVGSLKTVLISQDMADIVHSPMMIMKIVIKCADIGHSSKRVALHAKWSDLIIEEFFLQGDDEQVLGMDISPFMNRNSENSAKNQVGFFEFIILPFFEVVAEVVFRAEFKMILDQAHQNYKLWKKAEAQQLKSIKDILEQVFEVECMASCSNGGGGSATASMTSRTLTNSALALAALQQDALPTDISATEDGNGTTAPIRTSRLAQHSANEE